MTIFGPGRKLIYANGARVFQPRASEVVTYLHDTFTDAEGTLLSAHTMDVGPGWTDASDDWRIQNNLARIAVNFSTAYTNASATQYVAQVYMWSTASSTSLIRGMRLWMNAGLTSYYDVGYKFADQFQIRDATGAILATTLWTGDLINRLIKCVCSGTTITATLDGGSEISATGLTPNSYVGITGRRTSDYYNDLLVASAIP